MNLKQQAAEQMKRRIIEITIEIIGTEGVLGFSAAKLSQQAGISKGALYHHFDSLDAVRLAALQALIDALMTPRDTSAYPSLSSYLDDVGEQVFVAMEQEPVAMKALAGFMQLAMFDSTFQSQMKQLIEHSFQQYAEGFRFFFPDLTDVQMATVVQMIDAHFGGSMLQWYLLNTPQQCRDSWAMFSKMLCHSIEQGAL